MILLMIKDNIALSRKVYVDQIKGLLLTKFAEHSPVWIYMSSRELTAAESAEMETAVQQFAKSWLSHGSAVAGFGVVLFNRFLILSANAGQIAPSGCSIDSSVGFVKSLEEEYSLDFFDRMKVAFIDEEGEIDTISINSVHNAVSEGTVNEKTPIFDNTITQVGPFADKWIVPLEDSWVRNFL